MSSDYGIYKEAEIVLHCFCFCLFQMRQSFCLKPFIYLNM